MDDQTTDGLKDTARMHADRDEVQSGIPLLLSMLAAGVLGALAVRSVLSGGIVEWTAMLGAFAVGAHATGIVYSMVYSKVRTEGDGGEH